MTIRFVRSSEKKRIIEEIDNQFGITELPFLLLETGNDKFRGFSGHLSKEELAKLAHIANVEIVGLYLLKKEHGFRLSFDASTLLKNQISKNILYLSDAEFYEWIHGRDIDKEVPQGTYIIGHNGDFLGCGKSNGKRVFNYVPKDRRIKKG